MLSCLVGVCPTVGFSQNILQLQLLPNLLPQESTTCYKYVWCVLQKSKVCLAPGSRLLLVFPKLRYQLSLSLIPSPSAASLFTTRIIFGLVWQSSLQKCVRTLIFFVCVSKWNGFVEWKLSLPYESPNLCYFSPTANGSAKIHQIFWPTHGYSVSLRFLFFFPSAVANRLLL